MACVGVGIGLAACAQHPPGWTTEQGTSAEKTTPAANGEVSSGTIIEGVKGCLTHPDFQQKGIVPSSAPVFVNVYRRARGIAADDPEANPSHSAGRSDSVLKIEHGVVYA